jgi:WD40 repeat protein
MQTTALRMKSGTAALRALAISAVLTTTCAAEWKARVDPPAKPVVWPATLKLELPQPPQYEEILFPHGQSPYCLGGLGAYESDKAVLVDLTTGQKAGGIKGKPGQASKRALSPDGQYLVQSLLQAGNPCQIEVWSLSTGQMVCTFQASETKASLHILDFAGPDQVVTHTLGSEGGKFRRTVCLWNAKTGEKIREFEAEKHLQDNYGISPGGRYLAAWVVPGIVVLDLQTGEQVGDVTPPDKTSEGKFVSVGGVRFSPDGKEIAVISTGLDAELICIYDAATGDEKAQLNVPPSAKSSVRHPASYKGPKVEFVAEPNGFLLYGSALIDRETGLHLWTYQQGDLEFAHWRRILTPAGLITSAGESSRKKIVVVPFPAETIQKSVAAYRQGVAALVTAGSKVKLDVKVGAVRFQKPEEAKTAIETALAERLAIDGLEVSPTGTTILSVQYQETVGKVLQEVQGGNIFGGGTPTGRSVQSTAGDVKISWTSADKKTKIFEQNFGLDPNYLRISGATELTEEKARGQVFEILKLQLADLPLPYFVPNDKSLSVLPVPTTSPAGRPSSPQDVINQRIEARKKALKK